MEVRASRVAPVSIVVRAPQRANKVPTSGIRETHDDREDRRSRGDLGHAPAELRLERLDEDREHVHAAGGSEEENHGERPDQLPAVEHPALGARVCHLGMPSFEVAGGLP